MSSNMSSNMPSLPPPATPPSLHPPSPPFAPGTMVTSVTELNAALQTAFSSGNSASIFLQPGTVFGLVAVLHTFEAGQRLLIYSNPDDPATISSAAAYTKLFVIGNGLSQVSIELRHLHITGFSEKNGVPDALMYVHANSGDGTNFDLRFIGCHLHHNRADTTYGGLLYLWHAVYRISFENCSIYDNSAHHYGGVAYLGGCDPAVAPCVSTVSFTSCAIYNNVVTTTDATGSGTGFGGGVLYVSSQRGSNPRPPASVRHALPGLELSG